MKVDVELDAVQDGLLANGTSAFRISVPEIDTRQFLYLPFDDFYHLFGAPEDIAADLLVLAGACYVTDQVVARSLFSDRWTREIEVTVPVREPGRWDPLAKTISEMLKFLTGDIWSLSFTERQERIYWQRVKRKNRPFRPTSTVSLFSGGVDSLVGAIKYLSDSDGAITLVGHYDLGSTAASAQACLATKLKRHYLGRINFNQQRIGPLQSRGGRSRVYKKVVKPANREATFRSRSLLFLALGTYFAVHHRWSDAVSLLIPENGLIALNPALTESRLGSCSTRTTHPLFLGRFQELVDALGLSTRIHNPLSHKTKGEVVAQCSNRALLQELLPYTVSCAHPTRRQGWVRKTANHCGYCVPCLFRRASLHAIDMDCGQDYGIDVLNGELDLSENIASDFRALLTWVYTIQEERDAKLAVAGMPIAFGFHSEALHLVKTGRDEVARLVTDKANPKILRWSGLA